MQEANKEGPSGGQNRILTMTEVVDDSKKTETITAARILMIAPATVSVVIGLWFLISINTVYKNDQSGLTWLMSNIFIEIIFGISILVTIICLIIGATIAVLAKKNNTL